MNNNNNNSCNKDWNNHIQNWVVLRWGRKKTIQDLYMNFSNRVLIFN